MSEDRVAETELAAMLEAFDKHPHSFTSYLDRCVALMDRLPVDDVIARVGDRLDLRSYLLNLAPLRSRALSGIADWSDAAMRAVLAWQQAQPATVRVPGFVGIGVVVSGYSADSIYTDNDRCGMSELLRRTGLEVLLDDADTAFRMPGDPYWRNEVERYQAISGRPYPPVYNIKIHVEAEPLSDEDAARWWLERSGPTYEACEDDVVSSTPDDSAEEPR